MEGGRASFLRSQMREIVFGIEDSLVSTMGAVTGIAVGVEDQSVVVLSGLVLVCVEAISMSAGSYLSSKSAREVEEMRQKRTKTRVRAIRSESVFSAFVMGVFYLLGGAVPLLWYFVSPLAVAIPASIVASLVTLFLVGALKGRVVGISPTRSGVEMLLVGGGAGLVGFAIGRFYVLS